MTYSLLICLIGLLVWLIFTKWQKVSDPWIAEVAKLAYFAGLLAWLFVVAGKSLL